MTKFYFSFTLLLVLHFQSNAQTGSMVEIGGTRIINAQDDFHGNGVGAGLEYVLGSKWSAAFGVSYSADNIYRNTTLNVNNSNTNFAYGFKMKTTAFAASLKYYPKKAGTGLFFGPGLLLLDHNNLYPRVENNQVIYEKNKNAILSAGVVLGLHVPCSRHLFLEAMNQDGILLGGGNNQFAGTLSLSLGYRF